MFEDSDEYEDYCEGMREYEAEAQEKKEAAVEAQKIMQEKENEALSEEFEKTEAEVFRIPEIPKLVARKVSTDTKKEERTSQWARDGNQAEEAESEAIEEVEETITAEATFNAAYNEDDKAVLPER